MTTIIRMSEEQLVQEIEGLDGLVGTVSEPHDRRAKWARAYLRQLLRDRQETLRLLRYRKCQGLNPVDASSAAAGVPGCSTH